jgi:GNAT superfamily N-acetyltransferase
MALRFPTGEERRDLRPRGRELLVVWPDFMHHDPVCNRLFGRVRSEHARLQFFAWDDQTDELVGEGNTVPTTWDGDPVSLPDAGIDAVLQAAFEDDAPEPNVLSALQIMVAPGRQGQGLSRRMVERMAELARAEGYRALIAPVRPSLKHRYPLVPIERYVTWRRPDGSHLDPWLRTHERLGGEILKVAPRSMAIPGTVAEWEEWAGMAFPESGAYVVPGALVPVEIDRERDQGLYVEPNVWMVHRLQR